MLLGLIPQTSSSEALHAAFPETFKDFNPVVFCVQLISTCYPLVSMLAPISVHKNVLDVRKTNNKTPININIITERGTADAEEE